MMMGIIGLSVGTTTETRDHHPSPAPASGLEEGTQVGPSTWNNRAWLIACGILALAILIAEIYYRCKRCITPTGRSEPTHMQIASQL